MPYEIHHWDDISAGFSGGSILIGNGASIAVDQSFGYGALLDEARRLQLFTPDVEALFSSFDTNDFELILRLVWHATKVNSVLQINDGRTRQVYQDVRRALIETVRAVHPLHSEVATRLPSMYQFLKQFKTVLSLNYDLLVYWTMAYGFDVDDGHQLKDCFVDGVFDDNWARFRKPIWGGRATTLVFYPHGSLALCRNVVDRESKIHGQGAGLLQAILDAWEGGRCVPLFVSEGTAAQKLSSIQNSHYLSTVYREVIPPLTGSLTIFGWSMGEQEEHLLKRLHLSGVNSVACSVYAGNQRFCDTAYRTLVDYLGDIDIRFYDSASAGWAISRW